MSQYLFIDFENTQKVRLDETGTAFEKIFIFVGRSQNKLDFELVQRLQGLGGRVEWVKIGGEGKNNLDFHLSYMLGRMDGEAEKSVGFIVLSRDKGYDALLRYIGDGGRPACRVDNLGKAAQASAGSEGRSGRRAHRARTAAADVPNAAEARILAALSRLPADQRPATKVRFLNYLQNQHGAGKTLPPAADILKALLDAGCIVLQDNRISYKLDK